MRRTSGPSGTPGTPTPVMPPANGPQSAGYDDSGWRVLDVPHDYAVEQLPSSTFEGNHGYRPKNISWYRRNITISAEHGRGIVWLEFDGVYRSSDFFLNGHYLGHHSSGYVRLKSPLATENLLENTDGVLRRERGGGSEHPISVLSRRQPATFNLC